MEIYCPTKFYPGVAISFIKTLWHHANEPTIFINFSNIGFINPYSALALAHGLKTIIQFRNKRKLITNFKGTDSNHGVVGYLKHLGFFKHCGLPLGKKVGEARGGTNYLPFTIIKKNQIVLKGHVMQHAIDLKSEHLAKILYPGKAGEGPTMMLAYAIRETIRNCFEHGGVDSCIVTAQRLINGQAEIAIADEGIGIQNSLARSGRHYSADEAIEACLMPGVSSFSITGDTDWANSGFGLYVVSELGRRYGSFDISSAQRSIRLNSMGRHTGPSELSGTLVGLNISMTDADYFPNILRQIVDQGEKIAASVPGARASASKMSKTPISH